MTRAELDAAYNARAGRTDLDERFAGWIAAGAAAKARFGGERDVAYGEHPLERFDRFDAGPGTPLVIFFHGGYWRALSKDHSAHVAAGLVPLGVSVVTVEYPLAPEVTLERMVAAAAAAVRAAAGSSPRVVVAGHSAGGHLAAMAAREVAVAAVASVSGLHDLRPIAASFVNEWLQLDAGRAKALSPELGAPAAPLALLAAVGEHELSGFQSQARSFVDAWGARGCATELMTTPDDDHFTVVERLQHPNDVLTRRIAELAR